MELGESQPGLLANEMTVGLNFPFTQEELHVLMVLESTLNRSDFIQKEAPDDDARISQEE